MKVSRKKNFARKTSFEEARVLLSDILLPEVDGTSAEDGGMVELNEEEIKTRAAYFLVGGAPTLTVHAVADGKYRLLLNPLDYFAAKEAGFKDCPARVYRFSEREAQEFLLVERLKSGQLGAMEEAYAMKKLNTDFKRTQEQIASLTGKSRPAVANTLRLLTLEPEVIGLIESGQLSAGHARALVKVPKDKQYPFAMETIKRGVSVRETERAVKAYLTPPEVLQSEKTAAAAAKSAELKAIVEKMRQTLGTKVSLIGNDKKGRIYIDYYSAEDLYRLEEYMDVIDSFKNR
ncbi:MAG: ParB/RepB/Spo0J family partition protein [Clostridia bacterium]|nr:ParB/RepB/Spo0J family partition protein [Clostridia bacterium]